MKQEYLEPTAYAYLVGQLEMHVRFCNQGVQSPQVAVDKMTSILAEFDETRKQSAEAQACEEVGQS